MTEVLFYHLQNQPVERVLPPLLEKSLERGWRVVVQAASEERADAVNAYVDANKPWELAKDPAKEALLHSEQPLRPGDIEGQKPRDRQIDILNLGHVEPVM